MIYFEKGGVFASISGNSHKNSILVYAHVWGGFGADTYSTCENNIERIQLVVCYFQWIF